MEHAVVVHPHPEFLKALDIGYQTFLGMVLLYVLSKFVQQMNQEKGSRPTRFIAGFQALWGANAIEGQAFILAVAGLAIYRIHLWWGVLAQPEFGAILAIAAFFLTSAPAATEHDTEHEKVVKWIVTFVGMINLATLTSTLMGDIQLCNPEHECAGPPQMFNMGALIAIGVASLYSGMLSRRSRWNSFMAMSPPLSVVRLLQVVGAGSGFWVRRDTVVKAFLAGDVKQAVVLLEQNITEVLPEASYGLWSKAVEDARTFFELEPSGHNGHHDDHEEHALHPI